MRTWPDDADGDALRRIERDGFDFDTPCTIDFNVDFDHWPPTAEAMSLLQAKFPGAKAYGDGAGGYVQFQVRALLSHALVTRVQDEVTTLMAPHGGTCESWGVLVP